MRGSFYPETELIDQAFNGYDTHFLALMNAGQIKGLLVFN